MLAMALRAPRGVRLHVLSFTTIASMLAPTTPQANKLALPSLCRSEHARDGLQGAAGCQASRFIVYNHREHARSYTPQPDELALPSLCRSEHARDGLQGAAGCQASRFIVYDHREHARSYHTPGQQTGTTITL